MSRVLFLLPVDGQISNLPVLIYTLEWTETFKELLTVSVYLKNTTERPRPEPEARGPLELDLSMLTFTLGGYASACETTWRIYY